MNVPPNIIVSMPREPRAKGSGFGTRKEEGRAVDITRRKSDLWRALSFGRQNTYTHTDARKSGRVRVTGWQEWREARGFECMPFADAAIVRVCGHFYTAHKFDVYVRAHHRVLYVRLRMSNRSRGFG